MPVFDIETDGLNPTKIHVVSWMDDNGDVQYTHDYVSMRIFFEEAHTLIGHNIVRYDIPAVEKILGVKITAHIVDTLALSWYINHDRGSHGLEGYGEDYGVPKPKITDWESLSLEEYAHRCNEDVKINTRLWRDLNSKLNKLYPEEEDKLRLIDYLSFKLKCAAQQEALQWKLDVPKAKAHLQEWDKLKSEKIDQLADVMPPLQKFTVRNRPKVYFKSDGDLSAHGSKWEQLCKDHKVSSSTQSLRVKTGEEKANPNSVQQVKDWLFMLGWEPRTFKFMREEDGSTRKLEQIRKDGELCPSVLDLVDQEPAISLLDGLTVLTHRIGIIKSFVDMEKNGYVQATVAGVTNTLRFRHARPLVNLPSVDRQYGKEIRGCLTAPEGYTLCGADMTSLEDTTKRHYMKPLDPDYVAEMSKDGFDPHLDLAKHAGVVTQEDIDEHNSGGRSLKALRKNYKVVNYSATYGVGKSTLSRNTGMSESEAQKLLEAFWSRNWSVEKVSKDVRTRELFGHMWLYNPVSKFWYSLRSDKDKFSTLNQGTGVYCFDSWVRLCRAKGIKTIGQFHDEVIALVKEGEEIETAMNMEYSIQELNAELNLNVPLGVDAQFGDSYADIH
tara:strand:+ start:4735 stop:6567 length:1833 start_codon:yes stop_codon:yes gene_type:complete